MQKHARVCTYLCIPRDVGAERDYLLPPLHLSDDAARVLHVGLAAGQEGLRAQTPCPAVAAAAPCGTRENGRRGGR